MVPMMSSHPLSPPLRFIERTVTVTEVALTAGIPLMLIAKR